MTLSVCVLGEGDRVHAELPASCARTEARLEALRGETVAFQVVVQDEARNLDDVTIEAPPLAGRVASLPLSGFVEHFVPVTRRSRDEHEPSTSLAWTPEARPPDDEVTGLLPDALIPVHLARCGEGSGRAFCPYPMRVERGAVAAIWFDVFVPPSTPPGLYATRASIAARGRSMGSVDVELEVRPARLPESAVSFFAYYSYDTLKAQFENPTEAERSVAQVLHAHHVDAFPALTDRSDVDRIADALSGDLFIPANGYRGPGERRPLGIAPIGAYGSLGEPSARGAERALEIRARFGARAPETFLYAIDEQCGAATVPAWQSALGPGLRVGETCARSAVDEAADVVMVPAEAFDEQRAARARARGKRVYVYNGRLPFAGPLVIDAPLVGLTANGWIAASYDVGRWFLWEATFWHDDNRGGLGERDVFADPESFHDADGDAALGDGLLVYPARLPRWRAHSLERDEVIPSMRLKALRRGAEDAGLLALAASVDRGAALEVDRRVIGAALGDVSVQDGPEIALDSRAYAAARVRLREIIGKRDLELTPDEVEGSIRALQTARRSRSIVPRRFGEGALAAVVAAVFALSLSISRATARRPRAQR